MNWLRFSEHNAVSHWRQCTVLLITLLVACASISHAHAGQTQFGSHQFDDRHFLSFAHQDHMLADNGEVQLQFTTTNARAKQGLFSKDGRTFLDGGHLSIWLQNQSIHVRMQSTNESYTLQSEPVIQSHREYAMALRFGANGLQLSLDGQLVASHPYAGGMAATSGGSGNMQPVIIGALATHSSAEGNDNLRDFFRGSIKNAAFFTDNEVGGDTQPGPIAGQASSAPIAGPNRVISLIDGANQSAFAHQEIRLRQTQTDGKTRDIARMQTNEAGQLLVSLAPGEYQVQATTTATGKRFRSRFFNAQQDTSVTIGKAPLSLTVTEALSGAPLRGIRVDAYDSSGEKRRHIGRIDTDENGQGTFEFLEATDSTLVQFRVKYLGSYQSFSPKYTPSGNVNWAVGSTRIVLKDGTQAGAPALAEHDVTLVRLDADKARHVARMKTNAAGMVQFDLPELDEGKQFEIRAKSVVDGGKTYTKVISASGQQDFVVGTTPLTVHAIHGQTGVPLPDLKIVVREILEDGKSKHVSSKNTDASGVRQFDLPDLGESQTVFLEAKTASNFTVRSAPISVKGRVDFSVGTTQIQLLDGSKSEPTPLGGQKISLRTRRDDGKFRGWKSVTADENGIALVNLPEVSTENPVEIQVRSLIDSSGYFSSVLTSEGSHQLAVGTTPVQVTLIHDRTNQPIADKHVGLERQLEDGSFARLDGVHSRKTDGSGVAIFDVPSLSSDHVYRLNTKVFNNVRFYSKPFNGAQSVEMRAGKLQLTVLNGNVEGTPPMANKKVDVRLRTEGEDKSEWVAGPRSDDNGLIQLDLADIDANQQYFIQASSELNGTRKYQDIPLTGDVTWAVGSLPVTVNVSEFVGDMPVESIRVDAERQDEAGEWQREQRKTTDEMGNAVFDLEGIATGVAYRFSVKKYNAAVYSDIVSSPGTVNLQVGNLPITLLEKETREPLSGKSITAFQYMLDGSLERKASGRTNDAGQVTFDVPELGVVRYVLEARNVVGIKRFYSAVISQRGQFEFLVSEDDNPDLDNQAPQLTLTSPAGNNVVENGFVLAGFAGDDKGVDRLEISVTDNFGNENQMVLNDLDAGLYQAAVPGEWVLLDAQITVAMTLYDDSGNSTELSRNFSVIEDTEAPVLVITSHQDDDNANVNGFTLVGTVSDNIQVSSLVADLIQNGETSLITAQQVQFDPTSGQWAVFVGPGLVTLDSQLLFSIAAEDASGNLSIANVTLNTVAPDTSTGQLVRRATFGATPALENEIVTQGPDAWLAQQLAPETIDDSEAQAMVAGLNIQDLDDLRQRELIYQIYSKRHLQQLMAWFWENHFSTDYRSHDEVAYEEMENTAFRSLALTDFRALLSASAKSPAMLEYLDNANSVKRRPNQNYAREVMELHTLGVDGGYTQDDIEELARVFTGWQVNNGQFFYNQEDHDEGSKTVLGVEFAPNGQQEGEDALTMLVNHPSTSRFICAKLVNFFVTEDVYAASVPAPVQTAHTQCANTFQATSGNIPAVLRSIFESDAFNSNVANKVKNPLEVYVSTFRALQGAPDLDDGVEWVEDMGMSLFMHPAPDGFSDEGADWINVQTLMQRTQFAARLAFEQDGGEIDLLAFLTQQNALAPEAIVNYLGNLLMSGHMSAAERQIALDVLNEGGGFDPQANNATEKLQRLLATLLSFPSFQYH